jgi:hypothetical protein
MPSKICAARSGKAVTATIGVNEFVFCVDLIILVAVSPSSNVPQNENGGGTKVLEWVIYQCPSKIGPKRQR